MNFFAAQEQARRKTKWLVVLFALAVLGIVVLTNLLVIIFLAYINGTVTSFTTEATVQSFNWEQFIAVGSAVLLLIFLASLYKIMSLSSGGRAVAEMLNGQLIPGNTDNLQHRQLLNVVAEMAIASGSPVPSVYLLNEAGINAFAAGNTPQDAVIGITQGTLDNLNRDELQGVIGHEFSHILNGDMKLNIQLIGVLNGILVIYMLGSFLVRSLTVSRRSSHRKGNGKGGFLLLGLGLMIIGSIGKFFGQWIKAIISRQREYLADASAVQFTRNNMGIANALKKIAGLKAGSELQAALADEYSHAYFSEGVTSLWQSLFATHPPLQKRIKKIDPYWDGQYISFNTAQKNNQSSNQESSVQKTEKKEKISAAILTGAILSQSGKILQQAAEQVVAQVGRIDHENITYARNLLDQIPEGIKTAADEPYGARAVIYIMLIKNAKKDHLKLMNILQDKADSKVIEYSKHLYADFNALAVNTHLPLVELCMPSLKQLSIGQYQSFRKVVESLIAADQRVDLKEWFIQRLVLQTMDEHFSLRKRAKSIHYLLGAVKPEAELMLSLLADVEHKDENQARAAFLAAVKSVGAGALKYTQGQKFSLEQLNQAVDKLSQLKPLLKQKFLRMCAVVILYDAKVSDRGLEILRAISSALDCPMPPINKS